MCGNNTFPGCLWQPRSVWQREKLLLGRLCSCPSLHSRFKCYSFWSPFVPPLLAKSCFFFFFPMSFWWISPALAEYLALKGQEKRKNGGFKFCLFHSNQGPHPCNSYLRNESKETECEAGTLWVSIQTDGVGEECGKAPIVPERNASIRSCTTSQLGRIGRVLISSLQDAWGLAAWRIVGIPTASWHGSSPGLLVAKAPLLKL